MIEILSVMAGIVIPYAGTFVFAAWRMSRFD